MKKYFFFAAFIALSIALAGCAQKAAEEATEDGAETTEAAAPAPLTLKDVTPTRGQIDSVSYLVGIQFGSFIKGYNFGKLNMAQVKKGMNDFINSKGNQRSPEFVKQFRVNPEDMNTLFSSYLQKRQAYVGLKNKEAGEKFLAANQKKAGVEVTESGLQYKIIEEGNLDKKPGPTDTVKVLYKGTLLNGDVFDQTPEGGDPVTFVVRQVISGWQEGLQLVGEGGKIQLFIPSDIAYGERGNQGIEPNSTLIFDVEVVEVLKKAEPVEEAPAVVE